MIESLDMNGAPLPLDAQKWIDDVCDAFETRLRAGEDPRIEEALADCPELHRPQLFRKLLKMELEYHRKRIEDDYRQRFPEYASEKDAAFSAPATLAPPTDFPVSEHRRDAAFPVIPGYEILEKLGEGGMGVVYKAHQVKLDRAVALKMMRAGQFAGSAERQRFRFEAEAIAALNHPNIVPVYDVGEAGGDSFLCLKFLEKGSLADQMKDRRYAPLEAAALMRAITLAVQHAHERGVLHRDLKPGNILLDAEDRPHVADFGLARRITAEQSLTPTGVIVGTLHYMAPEQARGERGVAVTADVYALGAILYELLTGVPPIQGATPLETLTRLSEGNAVARPSLRNGAVPIDLEAICLKCLERDPANRYASAAALADDLGRFLRDEPVSAQPPGVWDWLVQAMRTRPQPSHTYTWHAPMSLGGVLFVQHTTIFMLVMTNQPVWLLWIVMLAAWVGMTLVVSFLLVQRFRLAPMTERHSIIIAMGNLSAQVALLLSIRPQSFESTSDILRYYPPLTIVSGLCFFILGSTHWGRFLLIGLLVMALALVMAVWRETGPLLYATVVPLLLLWWGLALRSYVVRGGETAPANAASESNTTEL